MLDQYNRLIGRRHLDIGPGTGWYLANAQLPEGVDLTLVDLNRNSLNATSARLSRTRHTALIGDALEPLPPELGVFDSIGVNYLCHCLPGPWPAKGVVFEHLACHLDRHGVLFGATILGRQVRHSFGARRLMATYNKKGIFHNQDDDVDGLRTALERSLAEVDINVVGSVALFNARSPLGRP
jgi:SAM-dependent methyltransferase